MKDERESLGDKIFKLLDDGVRRVQELPNVDGRIAAIGDRLRDSGDHSSRRPPEPVTETRKESAPQAEEILDRETRSGCERLSADEDGLRRPGESRKVEETVRRPRDSRTPPLANATRAIATAAISLRATEIQDQSGKRGDEIPSCQPTATEERQRRNYFASYMARFGVFMVGVASVVAHWYPVDAIVIVALSIVPWLVSIYHYRG